jgi:hypothetical protein
MTVIQALFPDVLVRKKTAVERNKIEERLAIHKEEALRIDPASAEVACWRAQTLDLPKSARLGLGRQGKSPSSRARPSVPRRQKASTVNSLSAGSKAGRRAASTSFD